MKYTYNDLKQSAIGAFSSVLLFFALRGGDSGPFINPTLGFIIFIIWAYLLYEPFRKRRGKQIPPFILNILVSAAVCTILAYSFGLAAWADLSGFIWFGSPACLASLMAMPIAMLFDLTNLTNPLSRQYVSRRR